MKPPAQPQIDATAGADHALRAMLGAVPMPLVVIGARGHIDWANPAAHALLGQGLVGVPYVSALRQPRLIAAIGAVFGDGKPRQTRYLRSDMQGEARFRASCAPSPDIHGRSGGVLVAFEDISHVEEAGQMRQDFVANVSHELRMPLTSLLGFIETLGGAARDDAPARDRFLAIMQAEASRMNRLVSDLLALSQLEEIERTRPAETVDIGMIVERAAASLAPQAAARGAQIKLECPATPILVQGDDDQLQQLFVNLLENAIKYGTPGGKGGRAAQVRVQCAMRAGRVEITVSDQGPGIAPQHLPRLTERFYRVDNHRSRQMGGTGLGLAIVKHIVNRHRGRLRITSNLGKGSAFCVSLPLAADGPGAGRPQTQP